MKMKKVERTTELNFPGSRNSKAHREVQVDSQQTCVFGPGSIKMSYGWSRLRKAVLFLLYCSTRSGEVEFEHRFNLELFPIWDKTDAISMQKNCWKISMQGKGFIDLPRNLTQWKSLFCNALVSCTEFLQFKTDDGLMVMGCAQFGEHSCLFETTYKHTAVHEQAREFVLALSNFDKFRLWNLISADATIDADGSIKLTRKLLATILNHVGNLESVLYAYHNNIGEHVNINLPPCKSLYDFLEKLATKLNELGQCQERFEGLRLASTEILKFNANQPIPEKDIISDWKRYLVETVGIPLKTDPKAIYFQSDPPISQESETPKQLFEDLFRVSRDCMKDKYQIKFDNSDFPFKYYNKYKDIQKVIEKLKNQDCIGLAAGLGDEYWGRDFHCAVVAVAYGEKTKKKKKTVLQKQVAFLDLVALSDNG
eukprot:Gregarina_sp_Poly_1__3873@NODE_2159_length_2580_cov_4_643852_g1392_i0_p1_GENE_NODE_2159_length_2580_cov_4_643852_g1392_i0NODE_2159_length_2580_cov_4_643852_g1392_i0_p1_ORF_typecomplete_len425_score52_84_NODE_2159_length_2580_cov_4_643852_g1392_i01101384